MRFLLSLLFILSFIEGNAQVYTPWDFTVRIVGTVLGKDDFDTIPYPLYGAKIHVESETEIAVRDSFYVKLPSETLGGKPGRVEGNVGSAKIPKNKNLRIRVSYLGMETFEKVYTPKTEKIQNFSFNVINLDTIILKSNPITIEETQIIGELKEMFQRGDTVFFNAGAVEMPTGSMLLDLIRRLPGLHYDGTKLTYNGRDINEIRLNGDEFFKHDISIAINNMPYERIKYLKVYETKEDTISANAQSHLVMDMQTDKYYANVAFANAEGAGAVSPFTYQLKGDFNQHIKDRYELSINGSHQTTPTSFTPPHKRQRRSWTSMRIYDMQNHNMQISPYYEDSRMDNHTQSLSETSLPDFSLYSITDNKTIDRRKEFRLNQPLQAAGLFNNGMIWTMNANITYNETNSSSTSNTTTYSQRPYEEGSSQSLLPPSQLSNISINSNEQSQQNKGSNINVRWSGSLQHRLGAKEDMKLDVSLGLNNTRSRIHNQSAIKYYQLDDSASFFNRMINKPEDKAEGKATLNYNHRFGVHYWGLSYTITMKEDKLRNEYYDIHDDTQAAQYLTGGTTDGMTAIDSLSYKSKSRTSMQSMAARLTLQKGHYSLNINASINPTRQTIHTEQQNQILPDNSISAVLCNASVLAKFDKNLLKRYTLEYRYEQRLPVASAYMNLIDMTDPLNIRRGNTKLQKEDVHSIDMTITPNITFRVTSKASFYKKQSSSRIIVDPQTGKTTSEPVTINGNWSMSNTLIGILFSKTINIAYDINHRFTHTEFFTQKAGMQESVMTGVNNHYFTGELQKNIIKKDYTFVGTARYTLNSINNPAIDRHTTNGIFTANLSASIHKPTYCMFAVYLIYNNYHGNEMKSLNRDELQINLQASYKVLRSRRGTLFIECNDLFNQCHLATTTSSDYTWTENRTFGQSRFFLAGFKYQFNAFK